MDQHAFESEGTVDRGRRGLLKLVGGAFTAPFGVGAAAYKLDRSYADEDEDGIPDELERSSEFHRYLRGIFGEQFEGLDPNRRDLLLDVRYVGDAAVSEVTKERVVGLFRDNGIHMQWLDHPKRYDAARFERLYDYNAKQILWSPRSFYWREIESDLKNVALQLVVVPGKGEAPHEGKIYSPLTAHYARSREGYVYGVNVGNRAAIAEVDDTTLESRLVLHEIAHYALCHDDDDNSTNTGVMGTREEIDLMDHEWEQLRTGLSAIRDTSGFDVALRQCLWREYVSMPFGNRMP